MLDIERDEGRTGPGDAMPHTPAANRWAAFARAAAIVVAVFAAGLCGGFAARWIGMPLPFILGPLFVIAAFGLAGLEVQVVRRIRPAGQFVTGSAVGAQFTQAVMLKLLALLPLILGASVFAVFVCALAALILMRLMDIDEKSAFFATMPAGAAEMANIALRYGGLIEPITIAQTMRVALTVTAAPFLVYHFADHPDLRTISQAPLMPWLSIGLLAAGAVVLGFAFSRVNFPNSWFLGALIASAAFGASGLIEGRVPDVALTGAQVLIGCSLGAQFRKEFVTRLFRLMLCSLVAVLFSGCTLALTGALVAYLLGYPVPTMVLALAPAGIAEMTLTGKVLGLDAALIAGFHLLRIIMVLMLCVPAFRLFQWAIRARA
jgi:uncharacterized protein